MKIKLCGFKELASLKQALSYAPDYIGFIFYEGSHRYITPQKVRLLRQKLQPTLTHRPQPQFIGVFVDAPLETLLETIEIANLDGVQLHGTEPPHTLKSLKSALNHLIIWKAFRLKNTQTFHNAKQTYANLLEDSRVLNAILLDSYTPATYGGTGTPLNTSLLADWMTLKQPIILAGGIAAENLHTFTRQHVYALDVSSALENNHHQKDPRKIADFMQAFKKLTSPHP